MSDGLFTPDKETFERFAKEWIERTKKAMIYGTSHPEIYKTAQDEEIERLRAENEKLREAFLYEYPVRYIKGDLAIADDTISELETENEKLKAALMPFANMAQYIVAGAEDEDECKDVAFSVGELRAAAAAIRESGE